MTIQLLNGDCLALLPTLPANSVHCCVTSPPYYGLRDYGVDGQIGLESSLNDYIATMVQVFREVRRVLRDDSTLWLNIGDSYANDGKWGGETGGKQAYLDEANRKCVAREKRRTGLKPKDLLGVPWTLALALRADGWYLRSDIIWSKPSPMPESVVDRPTKSHEYLFLLTKSERYYFDMEAVKEPCVYSGKDTGVGYGRLSMIAPNDSRKDRSRNNRPAGWANAGNHSALDWARDEMQGRKTKASGNKSRKPRPGPDGSTSQQAGNIPWEGSTRNKRSVWSIEHAEEQHAMFVATLLDELLEAGVDPALIKGVIEREWMDNPFKHLSAGLLTVWGIPTKPFPGHHFATFPPRLVEPCVLAGTSAMGCCATCGAPLTRMTERERVATRPGIDTKVNGHGSQVVGNRDPQRHVTSVVTTGWERSCGCDVGAGTVPCVVLDPFSGAGTTAMVAGQLGRDAIGIELNPAYVEMSRRRLEEAGVLGLFA